MIDIKTNEPTPDPDALYELMEKHADALMEHFDTIQIFATRQDSQENETERFSVGRGNFYARFGQAKLWCRVCEDDERDTEV